MSKNERDHASASYEVGYGRPPKRTRFRFPSGPVKSIARGGCFPLPSLTMHATAHLPFLFTTFDLVVISNSRYSPNRSMESSVNFAL